MLLLGLGNGYITIILLTWIQTRTPKTMLGRIMSLLMLASAGLVPVSQAISGAVGTWNLTLLFLLAGSFQWNIHAGSCLLHPRHIMYEQFG